MGSHWLARGTGGMCTCHESALDRSKILTGYLRRRRSYVQTVSITTALASPAQGTARQPYTGLHSRLL